jgi:hypothetical protein
MVLNTGYCGFPGVQFLSQIVLSQTCLDSGLTGYRCSDSAMMVSIQLPIFWISPMKWTA